MEIGIIGLGRMGGNMVRRLARAGVSVVGYTRNEATRAAFAAEGVIKPAASIVALAKALAPPRIAWLMVPAGSATALASAKLNFVDCGVSGGVWGLENGYALMFGGSDEGARAVEPFVKILAPAPDHGWLHCGPPGAGHFVKMIHNGIEYGDRKSV